MDAAVGASFDQISRVTMDVLEALLLSSVCNRGLAQFVQNPYETYINPGNPNGMKMYLKEAKVSDKDEYRIKISK